MLHLLQANTRTARHICTAVTAFSIVLFNASEIILPGDRTFRVAIASFCVFLILCVPTERLLRADKGSRFRRIVGGMYLIFLVMLLPRAVTAITEPLELFSSNLIQSLTFLSLVLLLVFNLAASLLLLKEESDKILRTISTTDQLTGLPNRKSFRDAALLLFKQHMKNGAPLAVIDFDLDDLQTINRVLGHNFGDLVLKNFAKVLRDTVREPGIVCRHGGGEFRLVLCDSDSEKTLAVTRMVMLSLKRIFMELNTGFIFTASGGFFAAVPSNGDTLEEYIQRAEQSLYIAKKTGKNKVMEWILAEDAASAQPRTR